LGGASLAWIFIKAWRDIWKWLQDLWKKIKDWFKNNKIDFPNLQEEFAESWDALARALQKAIEAARQWGIDLGKAFNLNFIPNFKISFKPMLEGIRQAWKVVEDYFLGLPSPVNVFDSMLDGIKVAWKKIEDFFLGVPGFFKGLSVASWFAPVGLAISNWWTSFGWMAMWSAFTTAIIKAWDKTGEWFKNMGSEIAKWWNNIDWNKVNETAKTYIAEPLILILSAALIAATGGALLPALAGLLQSLSPKLQPLANSLGLSIGEATGKGFETGSKPILLASAGSISGIINNQQENVNKSGSNLGIGLGNAFSLEAITRVKAAMVSVYNNIKEKFDTIIIEAKEWAKSVWNSFIEGTTEKIEDIKAKLVDIKDKMKEKIGDIILEAKEWGKDIIDGLIEGIKNGTSDAIEAIREFAEKIIEKSKEFFKISSPSAVFENIGSNVMAGFGLGLENGAKALNKLKTDVSLGKIAYGNVIGKDTVSSSLPSTDSNNSLVSAIISALNSNNNNSIGTPVEKNNVASDYVLVPINKRDLNRELYILQQHEIARRGA